MDVDRGAWANAERYGHDIIGNLNNYMTAWCDWNLVQDETGGPNHVQISLSLYSSGSSFTAFSNSLDIIGFRTYLYTPRSTAAFAN